jgi:hypothetical protein
MQGFIDRPRVTEVHNDSVVVSACDLQWRDKLMVNSVNGVSAVLQELFQHLRRMDVGAKQKDRSFDAVQHTFTDSGLRGSVVHLRRAAEKLGQQLGWPAWTCEGVILAEVLRSTPSTLVNSPIRIQMLIYFGFSFNPIIEGFAVFVTALFVFRIRVASNVFFTSGDHVSGIGWHHASPLAWQHWVNGFSATVLYGMIAVHGHWPPA